MGGFFAYGYLCLRDGPGGRGAWLRRGLRLPLISTRAAGRDIRSGMMIRVIFCLLVFSLVAVGQEAPTITVRKGDRVSLAVAPLGGASGPNVTKVLQNDLDLSGWFQLVPDARGSFVVGGTAAGGTLQGRGTDSSGATVRAKARFIIRSTTSMTMPCPLAPAILRLWSKSS